MRVMNWIRNCSLFLFSVIIALMLSEIILRIDGRYADQVNLQITEVNTNKIWTRESNSKDTRKHPDLGYDIELLYDEIGARKSNFSRTERDLIAGVFGDSFAENRRIENNYSFTEVLNEISHETHFINFGVDGYGLEQNFQHWIDKQPLVGMDLVFYLFCANDLEDTYGVQLFDRDEMAKGRVVNQAIINVPLFVRAASKFHFTYLFIESYYIFKSIGMSPDKLTEQLARRFSDANLEFRERLFDDYVSSLTRNLLNERPDPRTMKVISHFEATLQEWNKQVESRGGEFVVLILPREIESVISKLIIPTNIKSINLAEYDGYKLPNNRSWDFNEDGHWNEYGNLTAALALHQFLTKAGYINRSKNVIKSSVWEEYLSKINLLYQETNP